MIYLVEYQENGDRGKTETFTDKTEAIIRSVFILQNYRDLDYLFVGEDAFAPREYG